MTKRANKYRIALEQVSLAKEGAIQPPMHLEFENHDEIFGIIKIIKEKNLFGDTNQSVEFALGLKLFTEVMLKNKSHPLFEELFPAVSAFMKKTQE